MKNQTTQVEVEGKATDAVDQNCSGQICEVRVRLTKIPAGFRVTVIQRRILILENGEEQLLSKDTEHGEVEGFNLDLIERRAREVAENVPMNDGLVLKAANFAFLRWISTNWGLVLPESAMSE